MNTSSLAGKVIRAPSLKRGKNGEASLGEKVKLERVLGLTVSSNAALDCDPDTELVVYPAGCTVVLFNPIKNRQSHLLNSSRKTITCLALSPDGHYLVTGECGHLPLVRVWDLHEEGSPGVQVAELPSHKYGINCVAFSPSNKYVVSVGSQHDMIVNVWDWKTNLKVASNKVSTKVKAVSFAENGSYFVTVGNRHVKFWYLEYSRSSKIKEAVPLMGRSAILGEQRNNYFCDVACGHGKTGDSTYAITKSGLLCEFNNRRLLDKWVELRTTSANCIALGENFIFIGCAEGIVRCFTPSTLQFVTTLPRTHYLGVDVAQGLSISHMAVHPMNAKYPDAIALAYDPQNCKLTCIYNDHSMYIWDVRDIKRVGKSYSFLFHSACIWGVDMYPVLEDNTTSAMPHGCFITCSSDDTIRVWNLDPSLPLLNETLYKRNIYSTDLMKVLYVDSDLTYLKDLDTSVAGTADKNDSSYDSRNGVRSLRISPDGKHLASGDRAGNIRIHHLITLQELCRIEAHDAEVLCLEYSRPESGHRLLASASRDRLIHIFNVDEEYNFVQTLDDHSSSITAVKFLHSAQQLQMVSCGADKSIIFRQLQSTPGGSQIQFSRGHNVAGKTTLYDMEVDSGQKHILTACQDRSIRVYNVNTGKHSKSFKGSISEDGSLIKVVLDNSGIYAATSCTDKTLCIYDYYSGECMATMYGHSELVTGLKFTNDCRKLISASGDGCIFVWKVPHDMVVTMHARLSQQAARLGKKLLQSSSISLEKEYLVDPPPELLDPNSTPNDPANYRFTLTQLPFWAKKQMSEHTSPPLSLSNKQRDLPRGRWAQRLDTGEIKVKSVYDNDSVIQISGNQEKKHDSDGSKDSSIDSGTELRNYMEVRQEGITSKQSVREITELPRNRNFTDDSSIGSYKYEDIESTEHDGDVEDYSEGEGESTEPEQVHFPQVYYPPAEETGSDYTVNAMDVEELRRSQRRCRKNQRPEKLTELPLISVSASVSGSQDSEDDDEDASTPSAETGEKNLLSMLSISTESLDFVGKREKFLKNTFESLSGTEVDADRNNDTGGTSISSQFLVRTSQNINYLTTPAARNVAVINATKQTRSDNETSSKREELQRRIEETRRKLQSVGYRSNLKTSQSISDLSRIPEKDFRNHHGVNLAHRYTTSGVAGSDDCVEGSSGSLRRACSLSDIANPTPRRVLHDTLAKVSGRMVSKSTSNTRTLSRHGTKQAASVNSVNIKRSTSMGVLNQSDSESDISLTQRPTASLRVTGIMRPTISSQNKITVNQNKINTSAVINRRRGISSAYSSVNLSQVGSNEDSSSEETSPGGGKPAHSIRPRSTSADRLILGASSSLSTTVIQPQPPPRYSRDPIRFVTQRLAASKSKPTPAARHGQLESAHQEFPCKDSDILFKPLSLHLCTSVADQLTRTAENVVQLRKRISTEGDTVSELQKHNMVKALEEAINEAQHTLQLVAMPTNTSDQSTDPTLAIKLQELYSMVQQRMNQSSL